MNLSISPLTISLSLSWIEVLLFSWVVLGYKIYTLHRERTQLQEQRTACERELSATRKSLAKSQSKNKNLKEELARKNNELSEKQSELENFREELARKNNGLTEKQSELENLRDELTRKESELAMTTEEHTKSSSLWSTASNLVTSSDPIKVIDTFKYFTKTFLPFAWK